MKRLWALIIIVALIVDLIFVVAVVSDLSKSRNNNLIKTSGTIAYPYTPRDYVNPYQPHYRVSPYLPHWNIYQLFPKILNVSISPPAHACSVNIEVSRRTLDI